MKKNPMTVSDLNLVNLTYNGKIISFLLSSDIIKKYDFNLLYQ